MSSPFTVACIQFTAVDDEKPATIDRALRLVRERYLRLDRRRPELSSSIAVPRTLRTAAV